MLSEMGSKMKLKRGQVIRYSLDGADDVVTAKVLGRAGKSTGKYKNSYNVEYKAPENGYIHNTDPQSMDHHLDWVHGPPSWTTFMDPPINK